MFNFIFEFIALCRSIKHWYRMINFVKKLSKLNNYKDYTYMREYINESWYSEDCALCRRHGMGQDCIPPDIGHNCILVINGLTCHHDDSDWSKVEDSKLWIDWLENARKFVKFLKNIRRHFIKFYFKRENL